MPGTGMNVPMRYTTMPPIRNRNRLLSSVKRVASPKAATGLLAGVLATRCPRRGGSGRLDLTTRGFDRLARALGHADATDRDGDLDLPGAHDACALGVRRHEVRPLERGEIDHSTLDA